MLQCGLKMESASSMVLKCILPQMVTTACIYRIALAQKKNYALASPDFGGKYSTCQLCTHSMPTSAYT